MASLNGKGLNTRNLFNDIRFPEGRFYEDIATTYKILAKAISVTTISDKLFHYRIRHGSISNSHSMKNPIDYWLAAYEMQAELKGQSKEYYDPLVERCIGAIGRLWRWYDGGTKEKKQLLLTHWMRCRNSSMKTTER